MSKIVFIMRNRGFDSSYKKYGINLKVRVSIINGGK